jgi:hypothetical protein
MNEPRQPEDPIWSRWRERHGPGNGAPRHEAPAEATTDRVRLGDPLDPDWAEGPGGAAEEPRAESQARAPVEHECLDWCPICRTADVVRASFPPEVRSQLEDVQRDALVAIRTVLDHYIERLDAHERPESRVEDIPIR